MTPELDRIRGLLLALVVVTTAGLIAELVLLEHYEDALQWIPLLLLGPGLIVMIIAAARPVRPVIHAVRWTMGSYIAAGLLGVVLHYRGNAEFERERRPSLSGFALVWESLTGATPALAPAALAQLGLLGLVFTWHHPALREGGRDQHTERT